MQYKHLGEIVQTEYENIVGLVVLQNGSVRYENYFQDFAAEDTFHVSSVTKSVFSALVGIAVNHGFIQSIDQKVLEFFPEHTHPAQDRYAQQVTIRHLLTMTAPYQYQMEPYEEFFANESWVTAALGYLGGAEPGQFRYAPLIGPDILSGILVQATGKPVLEFAREHLFAPLGISVAGNRIFLSKEEQFAYYQAKSVSGWVADPQGVNTAAWGLALSPMDMAKIGQLYLSNGMWENRRIVSETWIRESTKEQSRWGELPYGYLWWLVGDGAYAAMGDGGNAIYVNVPKKLVVAIASVMADEVKDRLDFIHTHVLPLFENAD